MTDEIDICPDCRFHDGSACTQEDIITDPKYDDDLMIDECVFFDAK